MSQVETLTLPHLAEYPLHLALFKNVKNAPFLRQQLLAGNSEFEYAFIDASVVLSRMHLLAACFRAINDMASSRLKSRNVHSEIVFSFSPNNNIAESFRRFGISDTTQHVLAVKVGHDQDITAASVQQHLQKNVQGEQVEVNDTILAELADQPRMRKIYKLNAQTKKGAVNDNLSMPGSSEIKELETAILGVMALKGS